MKRYLLLVVLLFANKSIAQNFQDTKGELQISNSGTATYTLPIAMPPSIKNVAPIINLIYSSGVKGGIAGQGWSINSISTISRIATRRDIDGFVDGVDFDDNDKLALDGQRLLLKAGTYWADGSTYETEYKSNTKIELKIENGGASTLFIVTSPDGSRTWYGSKGSGTYQNATSVNAWYIVHFEDTYGNAIDYNYSTIVYNSTNQLYIDTITFSGNVAAGIVSQGKIKFNYEAADRVERDYLKGVPVYASQILKDIEVSANNAPFRKYQLERVTDSFGYERVSKIRESNAQGEEANPVDFTYETSSATPTRREKSYVNNLNFSEIDTAGDYDGDGRLDFVADNKIFTKLFLENSGNAPINLPETYGSDKLFSATLIANNKLNQYQSIVQPIGNHDRIVFRSHDIKQNTSDDFKTFLFDNKIETGYTVNVDIPEYLEEPKHAKENRYLEGDFNGDGISEVLILSKESDRYELKLYPPPYDEDISYYLYWEYVDSEVYKDYLGNYHNIPLQLGARLVDLNPNSSTEDGSKGNSALYSGDWLSIYSNDYVSIMDMNGDSKSDILVIKPNGNYSIFEIKELNQAPWHEVVKLGEGTLDKYSKTKQMLFGDYNGDGKVDIMLPDTEGGAGHTLWHIYYSNPKPAGGSFFVKESHNIVEYRPNTGGDYETQVHFSNYYAIDINKDGKSDIVRVRRNYYKPHADWYNPGTWDINNHDTEWSVAGYTNNIGKVGASGFAQTYHSGNFNSDSPDIPIPLVSNYKYQGGNTDLVIVRGHYKKIEYYEFNKNVNTDNRLKTVKEASGNIVQTIDYSPMEPTSTYMSPLGNSNYDVYSSSDRVTYPNIELIKNPESYLVSKLTATINGVSKYQDFRYSGYVSNFNYGTVGFAKTTRSSWYLSPADAKIWTTQYNDVNLRGANIKTWTSTVAEGVFALGAPAGVLTTKTNVFDTNTKGGNIAAANNTVNDITIPNPVTADQGYKASNSITALSQVNPNLNVNYQAATVILKSGFSVNPGTNGVFRASSFAANEIAPPASNSSVYNVLLKKQIIQDHISGTKSETNFVYDGTVDSPAYYGLETQHITKNYSGSTLQGSSTVDTQYESNPTGVGSAYYIGRPKKVNSSNYNVASGDTRTAEETYTYTGNNLTKTEKKGHNTYAIVEDMTYDAVGNLLTKTVSAPDAPIAIAARTITDEYDTTKRFVIKKKDHQLFETHFVYNTLGQVTKSTDYLGVINDFIYDNWGKLTNTTVTNAAAIPLTTTIAYDKLSTGGYKTTTTNNLDAKTIVEYDVLGRAIVNSTKGFAANTMVSKQIVYDALGRKQKESEPYFSAPNLWTVYEYDYLMRPIKVTAPTGKIQTLSYSGLTATSNDDGKITTATTDALGNKVQTTDPGGTINFKYYANGALKESDYEGNKVTIVIDGWGNKVSMTDPSAGNYSYSYDAFGQLKTETTPNGTTSFLYDNAGKPTEKTIVGTNGNTDSRTTYAYNSLNQIISSTYIDNLEAKTTTNLHLYDSYKRLFKTTETTPYATFIKELLYDNLGRVDKETSTALALGKMSSKTVKNTYQNGFPWQILDDSTQQVLWQSNTLNERGQLLTASLGNGIAISNSYDQYGYATQIKHDKTSPTVSNMMTLNTAFEIKRGNLDSRTNSLFSRNEIFKYDGLDRLTEYTNGLGFQETQAYDDKGRITQNSVGTYAYNSTKTYQNKSITLTPEALGYYGAREGIFNDSMEDQTGWGVEKYPNTAFYSYDNTTAAHTGKNSLKLTNTTTTQQYVFSDKWVDINNTVATQYTYSAWVYSNNPQAELLLFMKDGANVVTYNNAVNNTTGSWVQITKTFLVPAHIKKLRLRLDNNGQGNIWFDDVQIRKTSDAPTATRALNVTYNTFKSPVQIEETGVDKISFTYNDGNDRSSMFYGGLQTDKLERTYRKHYSADGTMEIKHNKVTGAVEFVTYIGGDAYSAPVILKSDGTTPNYLYLHRDYQGTIVAISDQAGAVVEKRLFDAWGNIVKVQDGAGNILAGLTVLDRGYTGHEHLQSVGIIHMNGRLYDPKLHRFLQPDNYVQEPFNTQNYNKYGYCWNNPLKYTDPSGEEIVLAIAIGAAVAALTYTLTAVFADVPFTVGGLAKATFIGAASAAVTFGIGSAAGNLFTNFYSQAAFQAVAHGTFQGTVTAISGGKFWSGFAAGALSSIASSAWGGGMSSETVDGVTTETMHHGLSGATGMTNGFGTIAFGTVSGGVGAKLTGGNFWQGAVTGLFVSAFNHTFHETGKNNTGLTTRRYATDENGNVTSESLNYFPKGSKLFNRAESEPLRQGELTVYSHGSNAGFADINNYNVNGGLSETLRLDSAMWRNFTSGQSKNLTMVLKACDTGSLRSYNNISRVLTHQNPGLTIYSPSHNWGSDGRIQYHKNSKLLYGNYNKYQDGIFLYSVPVK